MNKPMYILLLLTSISISCEFISVSIINKKKIKYVKNIKRVIIYILMGNYAVKMKE